MAPTDPRFGNISMASPDKSIDRRMPSRFLKPFATEKGERG
jgi:hypothetical protein